MLAVGVASLLVPSPWRLKFIPFNKLSIIKFYSWSLCKLAIVMNVVTLALKDSFVAHVNKNKK